MNLRSFLFISFIFLLSVSNVSAFGEFDYLNVNQEPIIRIGLATNARSVSITTTDSSLVAVSPDEPQRFLATTKVSVSARVYRPPEFDIYHFEIANLISSQEADAVAKDVREAINEKTLVKLDAKTNTWRVRVGEAKETIEEANEFKIGLSEKGFVAEIITEKIVQPSTDAVALSNQLKQGGKSEVRSLIKPTVSSQPTSAEVNPNLREVIVNGGKEASFSSLKSVAFGSINSRATPVRLNGKAYRGRIEVFVNSRGSLTVVNAVSLEDYLLGVVPNELSLPAIEAQKAQAIAARTYA
nr:SpoIID/LytB domain-containing protein [Acidobacteriota bacterium]